MKSIMKTTTDELSRILKTRRARIEINLETPTMEPVIEPGSENGKEEIEWKIRDYFNQQNPGR